MCSSDLRSGKSERRVLVGCCERLRSPSFALVGAFLRRDCRMPHSFPRPLSYLLSLAVAAAVLPAQTATKPEAARAFEPFLAKVKVRYDARWLYIESDGMPDHEMMTGITAWQQQVPLPQPYTGDNAWQVPLKPVPAAKPMSAKKIGRAHV